jgi:NAD(P)-dependent dehydrogenase (short-subunit alcohol dehydrogenase family)
MNDRLKDKRIIVVGCARGIGAESVRRAASEGARVCAADVDLEGAQAVAQRVTDDGGDCFALHVDLADERSVNECVAKAIDRFGGLDGAHINAADLSIIGQDTDALSLDLAIFDRTIAVNLRGHLLATRAVLPHLLSRGEGTIVYTSSDAAITSEDVRPAYAMSKGGLDALMRHIALRYGPRGVNANCIAPGFVHTPEGKASGFPTPERVAIQLSRIPGTRVGQVEDIAGVVSMLLSDDGRWINGQVYHVNGGSVMH